MGSDILRLLFHGHTGLRLRKAACKAALLALLLPSIAPGWSLGLIGPHVPMHGHLVQAHMRHIAPRGSEAKYTRITLPKYTNNHKLSTSHVIAKNGASRSKGKPVKHLHEKSVAYSPQNYIGQLQMRTARLEDGIVYRNVKGPLTINLLDIDLRNPRVKVRPILAGNSFSHLRDVSDSAKDAHALAAVNANYFKKNGTPLGTLIMNGEWVAGPLYDRVSLGITADGRVEVDRVKFGGVLETSNPAAPSIWINNINQPHRSGSHLIAYTRRWGGWVQLDYPGCLVALDATGRVVDKSDRSMTIPYGGMVLTDSRGSLISKLNEGDSTSVHWQVKPDEWHDVVQAVSGGPLLIKDGKLYVDCKDERFTNAWTGSHIRARTAAAVTANQHLLLVTIEGPHTLWDVAKFLQKMGAVDAMNLDGGGSTTMVVNGMAVTRAPKSAERRVASAFGVFIEPSARALTPAQTANFNPAVLRNAADSSPSAIDVSKNAKDLENFESVPIVSDSAPSQSPSIKPTAEAKGTAASENSPLSTPVTKTD
jgi:uncharacterized protein YigE (DUF2233 family)